MSDGTFRAQWRCRVCGSEFLTPWPFPVALCPCTGLSGTPCELLMWWEEADLGGPKGLPEFLL